MGATTSIVVIESEAPDTRPNLSERRRHILGYPRPSVGAETYFKSRLIADDPDLSTKEVGANMRPILDSSLNVTIGEQGYPFGTTWKVTI